MNTRRAALFLLAASTLNIGCAQLFHPVATPVPATAQAFIPSQSKIVSFYMGIGTDQSNRTIHDVWTYNFSQLEKVHDYIQWIFPTNEPSAHNPHAPILTDDEIEFMKNDSAIQGNLKYSFQRMLMFYGFELVTNPDDTLSVVPRIKFQERAKFWLARPHNYLRITRMLKCLRLLGKEEEAQAFFAALDQDIHQDPNFGPNGSYPIWKAAVN